MTGRSLPALPAGEEERSSENQEGAGQAEMGLWIGVGFRMENQAGQSIGPKADGKERGAEQEGIVPAVGFSSLDSHPDEKAPDQNRDDGSQQREDPVRIGFPLQRKNIEPEPPRGEDQEPGHNQ